MPVYDEYDKEYPQNIPDEPTVETNPTDEETQDAMQSQKVEARKDNKGTGGDSLPLWYASFELIQHMIQASKQRQKEIEMVQTRILYKKEDDEKKRLEAPSHTG